MRSILQCSTIVPKSDQYMLKPVRSTHVSHKTSKSHAPDMQSSSGGGGGGEAAEKLGLEHQTRTAAPIPFTPQPLRHMTTLHAPMHVAK